MTRLFILASFLLFALATNAKDMSAWSDRTMCRLAAELKDDSSFQWHMDKRGLVCTAGGHYREARYVTQTALCEQAHPAIEELPAKEWYTADYLPQTSFTFTSTSKPRLLAQADFNDDGLGDFLLASGNEDNQLALLYGQVNGKLQRHSLLSLDGLVQAIQGAKTADLNQDSLVDFIVYGANGSHWQFINIGHGFEATKIAALGNNNAIVDAVLIDINQDQRPDLVPLRAGKDKIKTPFLNTAKGFKVVGQSYNPAINNAQVSAVTGADFNGDQYADILFSLEGVDNQLLLLLGDQDLNNRANLFLQFPATGYKQSYSHLTSTDLNNDNQADIIHAYTYTIDDAIEATSLRAFVNQGDCFVDATKALFPDMPDALVHGKGQSAIGQIQHLDLNHDGLKDLLLQLQHQQANASILLNTGSQYKQVALAEWQADEQRLAGDINGDQMLDILALKPLSDKQWQLQAYLHVSPLTAPLAPAVPVDFERITEAQKEALQGFLQDHLVPAVTMQDAFAGTSQLASRKVSKVAWHLIPKDAPNEISFLGLDDVSIADNHWQILSKDVYFFYPTRDHRDSLEMHSNRQGQIILRGHMHVTPKELRQDIEIFGHRHNNFAMGVLHQGDVLLLEFLP